jgi:hypothetical protein
VCVIECWCWLVFGCVGVQVLMDVKMAIAGVFMCDEWVGGWACKAGCVGICAFVHVRVLVHGCTLLPQKQSLCVILDEIELHILNQNWAWHCAGVMSVANNC